MSTRTLDEHIELTPDTAGGRPRIRGRRITVQDIAIWHERLGKTADEIAAEYDLTLADVYAALAYYFDHREAIDERMAQDRALAEAFRARIPSKRIEEEPEARPDRSVHALTADLAGSLAGSRRSASNTRRMFTRP